MSGVCILYVRQMRENDEWICGKFKLSKSFIHIFSKKLKLK